VHAGEFGVIFADATRQSFVTWTDSGAGGQQAVPRVLSATPSP